MIAPPRPPAHDELEALIKEARAAPTAATAARRGGSRSRGGARPRRSTPSRSAARTAAPAAAPIGPARRAALPLLAALRQHSGALRRDRSRVASLRRRHDLQHESARRARLPPPAPRVTLHGARLPCAKCRAGRGIVPPMASQVARPISSMPRAPGSEVYAPTGSNWCGPQLATRRDSVTGHFSVDGPPAARCPLVHHPCVRSQRDSIAIARQPPAHVRS